MPSIHMNHDVLVSLVVKSCYGVMENLSKLLEILL